MVELTDRQLQVLEFIADHVLARGYPPSIREIGLRFAISSTNGVNDHLDALVEKGVLERDALTSRGLRITETGHAVLERTTTAERIFRLERRAAEWERAGNLPEAIALLMQAGGAWRHLAALTGTEAPSDCAEANFRQVAVLAERLAHAVFHEGRLRRGAN